MTPSAAMPAGTGSEMAPTRPHVVLSGFMAAGKSTVGARLAGALRVPFVDLDAALERAAGRTVAEIFEALGEAAFRDLEAAMLTEVLAGPPSVLAVGGGAMLRASNREAVRRIGGLLVTLDVSPDVARTRVLASGGDAVVRPNFDPDPAAWAARWETRQDAYADADAHVATDAMNVEAVTLAVQAALAARGVL